MTRADIERAAEEKYPEPERFTPQWVRAEWERAAYIRGRLDQAEADAQIAEDKRTGNYEYPDDWTEYAEAVNGTADGIADAIKKGVE